VRRAASGTSSTPTAGAGPRGHAGGALLQGKHKAVYTRTSTPAITCRRQCGRGEAHRPQGRPEDLSPHSGYEGGLREERAGVVRKRQPVRLVEEAVRGMLPKTKMGDAMYRKLKVYARADHPHTAQQPRKSRSQ
jgi:large subunit ribosomal protein L13